MPKLQHKSSNDIALAARRISVSQVVSGIPDPEKDEETRRAAVAKKERRKASMERLFLTQGVRKTIAEVMRACVEDLNKEQADTEHTPVSKLQFILTRAKGKESAERLFEYFVPDDHEDGLISREAFCNAMKSISPEFMQPMQKDMNVQFDYLDTNHDGNIDISEFMELCMAIPTLPWKAEKARQLGKNESTDTIVDAARNIERRKSIGKTIPIGEKLYEGKKFFWRTQEDVDIYIHENEDYGLITVSTRSHKSGICYPPLLVEVTKLNITSKDIAIAAEEIVKKHAEDTTENGSKLSIESSCTENMMEIRKKTRNDMITQYILKRLKVPDSVNKPPPLSPKKKAAAAGSAPSARSGPFIQKLSTDKEGGSSLLCQRGITIAKPYVFEPVKNKASASEFRRLSLDCNVLLNEAETFIESAAEQVKNLETIAESGGPGTSITLASN